LFNLFFLRRGIFLRLSLKPGPANRALQQVFDPADWEDRNDEEQRNETHALLLDKGADGSALPAPHLIWRRL
jgi:hypothetical protein